MESSVVESAFSKKSTNKFVKRGIVFIGKGRERGAGRMAVYMDESFAIETCVAVVFVVFMYCFWREGHSKPGCIV